MEGSQHMGLNFPKTVINIDVCLIFLASEPMIIKVDENGTDKPYSLKFSMVIKF
jgi:hypothetical protein